MSTKWHKFPEEKPSVSGEYLVRGVGGLNNKLHNWVCLWVEECADPEIANHPATQHCINTKGFDPYPGIERKDLASLGCPFPDEDVDMCSECSHNSISSVFTGECDLGIRIN